MRISDRDYLMHYGILRKSGRYPWGSGGPEYASNRSFLGYVATLKKQGMTESEVAKAFGISTTDLRASKSIALAGERAANITTAQRLKDKGMSTSAIGRQMNIPESTVRTLLAPGAKDKSDVVQNTANLLRQQVAEKRFVQIGAGVELQMDLSKERFATVIAVLKEEGYAVHNIQVDQLGTGGNKKTNVLVLAPPGTTYRDIKVDQHQIQLIQGWSDDGGRSIDGIKPPISIASNRVAVRYAEQGGAQADGVIYVRPGVKDITLGGARYAQVRIKVDDTHYLKGMAMYHDNLPPGADLLFNTNKNDTGNKLDALKKLNDDPENPFGSTLRRQIQEPGPDGVKRVTSVMNIVNEEGSWLEWSKSLSSQMLSKQAPSLAREQLDKKYDEKKEAFDEIMSLTNPTVRRKLLDSFSGEADSSANHLEAAALPRTVNHVILPINSMKDNEVYAPRYQDGERVVLIRHPHGGKFEIPELTVNNRNAEAKRLLKNAPDAIGIHHSVAARLSGADFDGDHVLVIPNNKGKIKTEPSLAALKNFDTKLYKLPEDSPIPRMDARTKGIEMGKISNLITDMTIGGADNHEIARAVKHSMVVIDAEKHELNYKQSAIDNGIPALKEKYQGKTNAGASTLISLAGATVYLPDRRERKASEGGPIDKVTGKRIFVPTGETYTNRNGKIVTSKIKSKRLAETDDAHTLSSGTPIEKIYADHSNKLKALANLARKEAVNTPSLEYSPSANKAYANEVGMLNSKLNIALKNAPLERQAQLVANTVVSAKRASNPGMTADELKKVKFQALEEARLRTGAKKDRIEISDSEWAAIQAGAISNSKLQDILTHANLDRVKELATPRSTILMTPTKTSRAKLLLDNGGSLSDVAAQLGVSVSTLENSLKGTVHG